MSCLLSEKGGNVAKSALASGEVDLSRNILAKNRAYILLENDKRQ